MYLCFRTQYSVVKLKKNFFSVNIGTTDRVGTVWEASKAYIRGKIIAHSSKKKRAQRQRLKKLETQLKDLERNIVIFY